MAVRGKCVANAWQRVNAARILTPYRRVGSMARRNTPGRSRGVLMGRRGRKRQLDVESRYWQLMLSGIEACRLVGITRKTGYRWRAENGGVPPSVLGEEVRSNRYPSLLERQRIAMLREQGHGVREIARRLDRCPSTISREVKRNLRPHDRDRYDGDLAHARPCPTAGVSPAAGPANPGSAVA